MFKLYYRGCNKSMFLSVVTGIKRCLDTDVPGPDMYVCIEETGVVYNTNTYAILYGIHRRCY